jgi:PKD repeat protein
MKTKFKTLLFMSLLLAGLKGSSQCSTYFWYSLGSGGVVTLYDSTLSNTIVHWDFGNGDTSNNGNFNFTYTYTTNGTYGICLTTTDTLTACTSTWCDTVTINLCQGAAAYGVSQTGFGDYSFAPYNLNLSGATISWNFGDGSNSTVSNPTHHFAASSNYQVCFKVIDVAAGCADSSCNTINVALCSYANYFNTDSFPTTGPTEHFYVANPNSGYTYNWRFGDGGTATGDSATHVYSVSNTYTVCLITSDATTGCVDSFCNSAYYDRCGINQPYIGISSNGLDASFSAYSYTPGVNYSWSFPGGTPSSASTENASSVYTALGTYSACAYLSLQGCTDTLCQNFTLTPPTYSISGNIYDGGNAACSIIYLIKQDTTGHLVLLDSLVSSDTLSACNGNYQFVGLPVDTYYVKAALKTTDPNYASYLPTYYGDVLSWVNATPVYLTNNAQGININLVAGNNTGGPGFVAGWVSQGAGLVVQGQNNYSRSGPGSPLANVQINLLTGTNGAVAYTYTDVNGHYQFSNLALGDYKIYAEELNKVPTPIQFTLTSQNMVDSTVNISINSNSATGVEDIASVNITSVYPNPVTTSTVLKVSCKQSAGASLKLVDVLGRTDMERKVSLVEGENTFEVNMENVAAGVYQLIVQTDSKRIASKVVKTK